MKIARSLVLSCALLTVPMSLAGFQKSAADQVAEAVTPLPEASRDGATVLGYGGGETLEVIREGTNDFICLADAPGNEGFQVACYHKSLDPFMARGRALRAEGKSESEVLEIRGAEVEAGTLSMPDRAMLMQLFGQINEATGVPDSVTPLHVMYLPYATAEETGLSVRPGAGPWLMQPGMYRAHMMLSGTPRKFER
ncbi:MAG: hypothetical protein O7I93_07445 [Gemmatimonadetes bacterium]|nr:hypothetical protein [Gemmatimonadota bacterium]